MSETTPTAKSRERVNPVAALGCLLTILVMLAILIVLGCMKGCEIVHDSWTGSHRVLQRAAK